MKCKDCIYYDKCCADDVDFEFYALNTQEETKCQLFKDKSKFVELPCKVGDIVYPIYNRKAFRCKANAIHISLAYNYSRIIVECILFDGICINKDFEYGKSVFLTIEEAKARLKELEGEQK